MGPNFIFYLVIDGESNSEDFLVICSCAIVNTKQGVENCLLTSLVLEIVVSIIRKGLAGLG